MFQGHCAHERSCQLRDALRAVRVGTALKPSDFELMGALGFLRESVEAEFMSLNEPAPIEEPVEEPRCAPAAPAPEGRQARWRS